MNWGGMLQGRASRSVSLAALALLALAPVAASADVLSVDVDGDGRYDQVELTPNTHDVVVRFSTQSRATAHLHTRASLVRIVATDLDHDGFTDLVASTASGLRVWINTGTGAFQKHKFTRHRRTGATWRPRVTRLPRDEGGVEVIQISGALEVGHAGFAAQPFAGRARTGASDSIPSRLDVPSGSLRGPPPSFRRRSI